MKINTLDGLCCRFYLMQLLHQQQKLLFFNPATAFMFIVYGIASDRRDNGTMMQKRKIR